MALEGSHEPARAAMGLIILRLHGRAPRGKQERLAFVRRGEAAGILARAADFRRELFRVGLNGALMKNGGHSGARCSSRDVLFSMPSDWG